MSGTTLPIIGTFKPRRLSELIRQDEGSFAETTTPLFRFGTVNCSYLEDFLIRRLSLSSDGFQIFEYHVSLVFETFFQKPEKGYRSLVSQY